MVRGSQQQQPWADHVAAAAPPPHPTPSNPIQPHGVSGSRCSSSSSSSRCQAQEQQQQQGLSRPGVPPLQQQQQHYHQQQAPPLRPPPARYAAHTSNLMSRGGSSSTTPAQQQQQQRHLQHHHHHHPPRWPGGKAHSSHPGGGDDAVCTCVLPRTSVLCRLLVLMTVLLVFIQAVSCGMFFCVTLPVSYHRSFVDYRDLVAEMNSPSLALAAAQAAQQQQQPAAVAAGTTTAAAGQASAAAGQAAAAAAAGAGGGGSSSQQQVQQLGQQPLKAVPKLIPRVIHQTFRSRRSLSAPAKAFTRSWAAINGDSWQVRFYTDDAALAFVQREFPEYFEAYLSLPKDVERADFFRYMVVLRLGGAYADVDAECRAPLDGVIAPADTLLVGWDTEVPDGNAAAAGGGGGGALTSLARRRLVANWFFAAAPGHPVLRDVCDFIARHAGATFSANGARDTAERTGQGLWTDVVLRHALQHAPAKHDDPWRVRILPRVAFGVRPTSAAADAAVIGGAGLRPDTPGVVVLHHFAASWQVARHRKALQLLRPWLGLSRPADAAGLQPPDPAAASNTSLYPVSVAFNPPFTMMTDLVGSGDSQAAADVSAAITAHGSWQPGLAPYRKPAVVEALVGALAKHSSPQAATAAAAASGSGGAARSAAGGQAGHAASSGSSSQGAPAGEGSPASSPGSSGGGAAAGASPAAAQGGVLVDVGAGHGFFSLAAAARGYRVIAFESSPGSLAAFQASIAYNGFQELITVHSSALGAVPEAICLHHTDGRAGCSGAGSSRAQLVQEGGAAVLASRPGRRLLPPVGSGAAANSSSGGAQQAAAAALRLRRGYPWLSDGPALPPDSPCCAARGSRLRLSDALANASDVAALRISAHGHEGWVLQGALDFLNRAGASKPGVIYLEFWPAGMRAAGYARPAGLLQQLHDLGYGDSAHAGRVCDRRWHNATRALHLQGSFSPAARMALQQPTWCKLRPENFGQLADSADLADAPENVLFLLSQPARQASSSSTAGVSSRGGSNSSSSVRDSSSSSSSGRSSSSSRPSNSISSGEGGSSDAVKGAARSSQQGPQAPAARAALGAPMSRAAAARIQPLRH